MIPPSFGSASGYGVGPYWAISGFLAVILGPLWLFLRLSWGLYWICFGPISGLMGVCYWSSSGYGFGSSLAMVGPFFGPILGLGGPNIWLSCWIWLCLSLGLYLACCWAFSWAWLALSLGLTFCLPMGLAVDMTMGLFWAGGPANGRPAAYYWVCVWSGLVMPLALLMGLSLTLDNALIYVLDNRLNNAPIMNWMISWLIPCQMPYLVYLGR